MPKRPKTPDPVTVAEVERAVLKAIAETFGDRPLDVETAKKGLAHAGFTLIEMHLREVAERAKK